MQARPPGVAVFQDPPKRGDRKESRSLPQRATPGPLRADDFGGSKEAPISDFVVGLSLEAGRVALSLAGPKGEATSSPAREVGQPPSRAQPAQGQRRLVATDPSGAA